MLFQYCRVLVAALVVSSKMNELGCGAGTAVVVNFSTFFINWSQSDSRGVVWWDAPGWLIGPWWNDIPCLRGWSALDVGCGCVVLCCDCLVHSLCVVVLRIDLPGIDPNCGFSWSLELNVTVRHLCGGDVHCPAQIVVGAAVVFERSGRFVLTCSIFPFAASVFL